MQIAYCSKSIFDDKFQKYFSTTLSILDLKKIAQIITNFTQLVFLFKYLSV